MDTGFVPPAPLPPRPAARDDDLTWLRLIRSRRVGPATFHRLVNEHGSVRAAFEALPEIAAAAGVADYSPCPEAVAAAELRAGRKAGAKLIRHDSPLYPPALRQIDASPPVLWLLGEADWLTLSPIAVIGARNASSLGLRMARGMAVGLGQNRHAVIAGMARGIDAAAHHAALATGTVAVLAGGVDIPYPAENTELLMRIAVQGAVISEQPPGTVPAARHFPARNRIISGLSQAVVVIEAAHRSGSLITARYALDQGRDVMAVPGHPMDSRASGCNQLIRDGAHLVRSAADVIEALEVQRPDRSSENATESDQSAPYPEQAVDPATWEAQILSQLTPSPTDENDLIRELGLSAAAANAAILALEVQGRIIRMPGGKIALN
ncbi:DNA-protecting protein DprA [Paracoccus onubensis]|uniref:DNA-protecting protein DprA n=1 Tax=Paracoccus onubensis TaxID=1675788 RepID=A0A418SQB1_9RHOB|nr:DNA-protecting protein DprA [Paracoccus onubensis]